MKKVYIFLADGFEETEAVTPWDMLIRAGADVKTVSINGRLTVTGSHGLEVKADMTLSAGVGDGDMLILPGGGRGTQNLAACPELKAALRAAFADGAFIAAICAAPTVLAAAGLLEGVEAVCFPGMESGMRGAIVTDKAVAVSGNIITAAGMGVSKEFGFALTAALFGDDAAQNLAERIVSR